MPERYTVPQFIDVEDKILGPITVRQFVIMLVTFILIFLLYKIFTFVFFIALGVVTLIVGGTLAFAKINGQPFHFFLLNLVQTFKRPTLRIWDKTISAVELREYARSATPPPPPLKIRKQPLATSKLAELALVVNTGGVYRPEDYS